LSLSGRKKLLQSDDDRIQYNNGNMSGWALTMPEDLNNHSNLEQSNVSNFYGIEGEIETHCLKFLHYKIVKDNNFK